jgi:hypothetical protein
LLSFARNDLDPLWVTGLTLLILFVGSRFNLRGEDFDWTEYLLLGTVFPAALLALHFLPRLYPSSASLLRITRLGLALFTILLTVSFIIRHGSYFAVGAALIQCLLMRHFLRASPDSGDAILAGREVGRFQAAVILFVTGISWVAASRFIFWAPTKDWILGSNYTFVIFVLTLLLVAASLYDRRGRDGAAPPRWVLWSAGNIVAFLIIGMVSLRTDKIFNPGEIHHWSFFTGPAQLVRQGGWLLWDVPSQYGFLSTLTIAWLPFETVWQSLFTINALFNFAIALFIFLLFCSARPGPVNLIFSLALAVAAVFFRPGLNTYFQGPSTLPNTGGMRFIWCYVLLALLFWEYRRHLGGKSSRRILLGGCAVWLIGVLWSVESTVYCSVVWLPAYAVLVWRRASDQYLEPPSAAARARAMAPWLSLPIILLLVAVGIIAIVYFIGLGHGPDWKAFAEYALSYRAGFFALPIDPRGIVWILVAVFCAAATTLYYVLAEKSEQAALPLMMGALGGLWALSSYFVSRSHPANVHNLSPIFCVVIGLMLYLFARHIERAWWRTVVKASFVPTLVMVILATFGSQEGMRDYLSSPQAGYTAVDQLIPLIDPKLDELLNTAQVKSTDPMIYVGQSELLVFFSATITEGGRATRLTTPAAWLPASPVYSLEPLPEGRRRVFLSRFGERTRMGGWLIEFKTAEPRFPWLFDYLRQNYTPGRIVENETWKLTWYDFKGEGADQSFNEKLSGGE